jgi:hypothetical protein
LIKKRDKRDINRLNILLNNYVSHRQRQEV